MNREGLLDLFREVVLKTPDGRLIGDKENRYNLYMFSYTGDSRLVYTFPRKARWPDGKVCNRDIMDDLAKALKDENTKAIKLIKEFNVSYGYEFKFDPEVHVWILNRNLWLSLLKKYGLTYESIPEFENRYEKKVLKKNYFRSILTKRYIRFDLYDPYRHLNLEHDGSHCHIPEVDLARDEYLRIMYPFLHIERIVDYDEKKRPECKDELKNIFDTYYERLYKTPYIFRYDDDIVSQQIQENQIDLDYIEYYLNRGYDLRLIRNKLAIELVRYADKNLRSLENLISA